MGADNLNLIIDREGTADALLESRGPNGGLIDRGQGRIHGYFFSERASREAVANVLLRGLGKTAQGRDAQRNSQIKLLYALAWLHGEQVTDIFLSAVEQLTADGCEALRQVAAAGHRIWLISDGHKQARLEKQLDPTILDPGAFLSQWSDRDDPPAAAPRPPYPSVRDDDIFFFRPGCSDHLTRSELKQVETTWSVAYPLVSKAASAGPLTLESLARCLRELFARCDDHEEELVALHAAQSALFAGRYLLHVNMPAFRHYTSLASRGDLERGTAAQLRAYTVPARSALLLLRILAPDIGLKIICDLDAGAVAADGATIELAGRAIAVPAAARGILRAQLAACRLLPHGPHTKLLVYTWGHAVPNLDRPIVTRWLGEARDEAGIAAQTSYNDWLHLDDLRWARRRGLTLQPMDRASGSRAFRR